MGKLIRQTDAMDDLEKSYWIELLPSMTDGQKDWLRISIETHDKKMKELEAKHGKIKTEEEKIKMREGYIEYLTS